MVSIDEQTAELIREVTGLEGWTIIEDFIQGRIADCEGKLIHSCKPEEIESTRAVRTALMGVLQHVSKLQEPTE